MSEPYLKRVMDVVASHLKESGLLPTASNSKGETIESVYCVYEADLKATLQTAVQKLAGVALVHQPSITNSGNYEEPDKHVAEFYIEVARNKATSDMNLTEIAETIYCMFHKFQVSKHISKDELKVNPTGFYCELMAQSMIAGDNTYIINFEIDYKL